MNAGRLSTPGRTRSCPHCKATILESSAVCPGCNHNLRFGVAQREPLQTPLRVDGTVRHPAEGGAWEYSVVLAVRNQRGEEISRQVVGVGALQPGEERSFSLAVEVFSTAEIKEAKPQAQGQSAQPVPQAARQPARSNVPSSSAPGRDPRPPAPPVPTAVVRPAGRDPGATLPPKTPGPATVDPRLVRDRKDRH